MRHAVFAAVFGLAVAAASAAPPFWESKPFTTWSDQELTQILNDSPWSQKVNVVLSAPPRATAEAGSRGGGGGLAESDGGGGRGFPVPTAQLKLVVSWQTALPIKQAIVRSRDGAGTPVSAETQTLLDRSEAQYIVTIGGLPVRYQRLIAGMKDGTVLKRGGKPPIAIEGIQAEQTKDALIVFFGFPRSEAITLEDKDVEFVTKLGMWDIKKKFRLKDMVFHGKLEL